MMKVRVKATGIIVEVTKCFGGGYSDKDGVYYTSSEVEIIKPEKNVYI